MQPRRSAAADEWRCFCCERNSSACLATAEVYSTDAGHLQSAFVLFLPEKIRPLDPRRVLLTMVPLVHRLRSSARDHHSNFLSRPNQVNASSLELGSHQCLAVVAGDLKSSKVMHL